MSIEKERDQTSPSADLRTRAVRENKLNCSIANQKHDLYLSALDKVIQRLPQQDSKTKDILSRIEYGFASSFQDYTHASNKTVALCKKAQQDMITKMRQLTEEYNEFKEKNDLDKLFAEQFDQETRKSLLANISSLMKRTDWHTIDKYILE
jgi:hypothetical protein